MFKITVSADSELRALIRDEVHGAMLSFSKAEINTLVLEAFRRVCGPSSSTLEPKIEELANTYVKAVVAGALGSARFDANERARIEVRDCVRPIVEAAVIKTLGGMDLQELTKQAVEKALQRIKITS